MKLLDFLLSHTKRVFRRGKLFSQYQICPYGRAFPLVESIEGRKEDYIV